MTEEEQKRYRRTVHRLASLRKAYVALQAAHVLRLHHHEQMDEASRFLRHTNVEQARRIKELEAQLEVAERAVGRATLEARNAKNRGVRRLLWW